MFVFIKAKIIKQNLDALVYNAFSEVLTMENKEEMTRLLDYIERHLNRKLGLEELAGVAYLSKYHFHRLFRRETGEPVTRYITKRRLARACADLALTEDRILDIALRYQYGSHEAFTRAFKRVYAVTPDEYRRQSLPSQGPGSVRVRVRAA
jgi:AraC-like DNA-binding protein